LDGTLLISSSRSRLTTSESPGRLERSDEAALGEQIHDQHQYRDELLAAESTNLSELVEPLTRLVLDLVETGARTARVQYGARGWVAHHNTDLWRASAPVDGPASGMWPTGGAWLCQTLWEHFEYTRDRAYLARIYPALKGASEFFLDTLVEEPAHKWLVTVPSASPENRHQFNNTTLTAGPAMDMQILRDLFTNTIRAAEILSVDRPLRDELAATRARLAPSQIGKAGQLQEWLEDWDMEARTCITGTSRTCTPVSERADHRPRVRRRSRPPRASRSRFAATTPRAGASAGG
jgi:alpha-L-fucosidase 2